MQRYRIVIAYDGTAYTGWQIQPNGLTVQEVLEKALAGLAGSETRVNGCSRTDQGVHARRQTAHFDAEVTMTDPALQKALNALLPDDVRVTDLVRTGANFDARRNAVQKEYLYRIWNAELLPPFVRQYRTHVRTPLDVRAMGRAASRLVGRHDFAAFAANPNREVESTVRTLYELTVSRRGPEVTVRAAGDGFLYKMVRSLAGFLIRVGEGAEAPDAATEVLASRERTARVPTAPPQGLFLWNITY